MRAATELSRLERNRPGCGSVNEAGGKRGRLRSSPITMTSNNQVESDAQ